MGCDGGAGALDCGVLPGMRNRAKITLSVHCGRACNVAVWAQALTSAAIAGWGRSLSRQRRLPAGRSRWCAAGGCWGSVSEPGGPVPGWGLAGLVVVLVGLDQVVQDPGELADVAGGQRLGEVAADPVGVGGPGLVEQQAPGRGERDA